MRPFTEADITAFAAGTEDVPAKRTLRGRFMNCVVATLTTLGVAGAGCVDPWVPLVPAAIAVAEGT